MGSGSFSPDCCVTKGGYYLECDKPLQRGGGGGGQNYNTSVTYFLNDPIVLNLMDRQFLYLFSA